MGITGWAVARAVGLAERGFLPDAVVRAGMRRLVAARLSQEEAADPGQRDAWWRRAWEGPIAVSPDIANLQHYEVPAEFFDLVLGPRRKYSCCWWPEGIDTLAAAEEAMLVLTAERADISDGASILDLGSGWGSFGLWAAERFPGSEVVGVSNSGRQREFVERQAAEAGLTNLTVVTADLNDYDPGRRFDRIVSVEMLEHVRNHREVFRRMSGWLTGDGSVFTHVFAHRRYAYPYEPGGPASWMAETFFTGGVMPSRSLLPEAAGPWFETSDDEWVGGGHYARTLEAWLQRLDARADLVREALAPVYGGDLDLWVQRWRMFFMACATLFSHRGGAEWGVVHQRFEPRARG